MPEMNESMKLAAQNAALRQELDHVEQLIPQVTPYTGKLPSTMAEYSTLPKPWRKQIAGENPAHLQDLMNRAAIANKLTVADKAAARQAEILKDCPFKNAEEFSALPERQRAKWAGKLTMEQKEAVSGVLPAEKGPGYL